MDRRQPVHVGDRPTPILTGPLANRPAAGRLGRKYLVQPPITTVSSVGGTTPSLMQIDTGTRWITPRAAFYFNGPLTLTATVVANTQRKTMGGVLPGGLLGVGNRAWIMVSTEARNLATAGGAITSTWRLKYGTATVAKFTLGFATGASVNPRETDFEVYLENINGVTNAQRALIRKTDPSNTLAVLSTGSPAVDSTVSQVLDYTVSFDRQVTAATKTYVKILYISAAIE